jgi:F-type H+-transporting ATPase subunit delta
MGSASRVALAASITALGSEKGVTRATGEELLSAGRDIAGSPQLRSVLVDPSIDAADKAKLIGSIFRGLGAPAERLLVGLATARWSDSDELIDGIEQIGIRAIAGSAAGAALESELFAFGRAVSSDHELELAVGSTLGDPAAKAELVSRLLDGTANPGTVAILRHLVQSPRGRRIGESIRSAAEIVADATGGVVALVTAAAEPTAAQLAKLTSTLTAQYGREPRIALRIDPAVIGGLRVQIGDDVIDGTIASRLTDLRLRLAG